MHPMKSAARILFLWLLLAFTCLGVAALQIYKNTAPGVDRFFGRHRLIDGVGNFGEVTPMLYRGGQPTREGFERLSEMGIKIVIDVGRSKRDERQIEQLRMRYVSIPWHCPFPKDEIFQRFLKLVRENPDKKIFVHCRLGDDRTGMMIAAYRMAVQGWTAEQAMQEMHFFGYSGVHHLLCPGLGGYEKSFPSHLKKNPSLRGLR